MKRVSSRPATRARLGILLLVALLWPLSTALAAPGDGRSAPLALVERLGRDSRALQRGPDGVLQAVFGVPLAEAGAVFFPVSHTRGLPDGYEPPDIVYTLGHPIRALVIDEFRALFAAAERDDAYLTIVSGYRSADYQATVFENAVTLQLAREDSIDRDEAERRAARAVAPPGHSQHQLGTTADLSSWEVGYGIRGSFAETTAGRWLAEHAWEYGFIIPYTKAAEPRTGYISEPWHLRWVGKPLAAFLWEQGYLTSANPTADDWLLALEEVMNGAITPPTPTPTATPTQTVTSTPTPGSTPTLTPLPPTEELVGALTGPSAKSGPHVSS